MVYLKDSGIQVLEFNNKTGLYKIRSRYDGTEQQVFLDQLIADGGNKEIENALKNN